MRPKDYSNYGLAQELKRQPNHNPTIVGEVIRRLLEVPYECTMKQATAPAAGAAPSETDDACAWTVWWTHHKARYTTPRQAALAAWSAAIDRERAAGAAPTDAEIDAVWKEGALRKDAEPSIRGQFRWAARAVLARWGAAAPAQEAEDAARYRWLRRWKGQEHEPPFTVQHEIDGTLWGGDLDAAIDAARARQEGSAA